MANELRIKRRISGTTDAPATLKAGEPAFNDVNDILWYGSGDDGAGNATSVIAIGGAGAFVDLSTGQVIGGTKTFSLSPLVPTVAAGDSSGKAASTAFVTAAIAASTVPDGDKGDITISGSGSTYTIDLGVVTLPKLAPIGAGTFIGNNTAGPASPVELTAAQAKAVLAITATDIGSGTFAAARMPAYTGDVTSAAGATANTIANNAVTNAKAADMPANTIKGNNTGAAADPADLTGAQVKAMLALTKADVQLGSVENTALSTWAGSANITTIGTLAAGTVPWARLSNVPASFTPSAHTLDSHSNVTIAANTAGEILKWDGTAWVNNTLAEAGIAAASHTHATSDITGLDSALAAKAPLASPAFTGTPTVPTAATGTATTQAASTAFVANEIASRLASSDAMIYKGAIDASLNPNYPAGSAGDTYRISVGGKIGGVAGKVVEAGDIIICNVDGSAAGDQATVGAKWDIIQTNIDGALTSAHIGATVQGYDATLAQLAALSTAANQGIYATGSDTFATFSLTAGGRALGGVAGTANAMLFFSAANTASEVTTTAGGRALLGAAGTANTLPYYSAANVVSLASLTGFGRSLIDDADAAAGRATLGLGSMATQNANAVAITGGTIDGIVIDGGTW